jgi:hypothetical protein
MRDSTKVVIGFGSIWGLYALGATLLGSFTMGSNDTTPEIVAVVLYGLTLLPSCILALWFQRRAAIWLLCLSGISLFGFTYQAFAQSVVSQPVAKLVGSLSWMLFLVAIPALLGIALLRTEKA